MASCKYCLQDGNIKKKTLARAIITRTPGELWERDLILRVGSEKNNRVFILVVVDHFTKWMEAWILKSKTDNEIKNSIEEICDAWGTIPKKIISDNGLEFKNRKLLAWEKMKNIQWEYGSLYHHGSTDWMRDITNLVGKDQENFRIW